MRWVFGSLLLSLIASTHAATYIAASGSLLDVSNSVRSAVSGDTVVIPAGSHVWDGTLVVNGKSLRIRGQTNDTWITASNNTAFATDTTNQPVVLEHFGMRQTGASTINSLILFAGVGTNCFVLNNVTFSNTTDWAVWVASPQNGKTGVGPFGVISGIWLKAVGESALSGFFIRQNEISGSWDAPTSTSYGSISNVVVENCVSTADTVLLFRPMLDGDNGMRCIFRHNLITNGFVGHHGPDSPGPTNSHHFTEYYKNDFVTTGGAWDFFIQFRGGTGLVYSNTTAYGGDGNMAIKVQSYCHLESTCGLCAACKTTEPTDYPLSQQPGRGVNDSGSEAVVMIRAWNNTFANGNFDDADGYASNPTWAVAAGRDYTNTAPVALVQWSYPDPRVNWTEETLPPGRRKPRVGKKDAAIIGPWFSIPASVDLSDYTFQLSSK